MSPETIAILLSWASSLSGYEIPTNTDLDVKYVPHSWFVKTLCNGETKCRFIGVFMDDEDPYTVYVHNFFEDSHTIYEASFVVHEMVHYLQYHSGEFDPYDCGDSFQRERQADFVQNEFLVRNGSPPIIRMANAVCAKEG